MLRWLVLVQAFVYLLIIPYLRSGVELGYNPPLIVSLLALAALGAGGFIPPLNKLHLHPVSATVTRLQPKPWLWIGWITLAVAYAVIAVRYGLLNRRQGSEFMAELYATFPLPVLAVLRIYELLLIPILILYTFGTGKGQEKQRLAILLTSAASLPFMGLADSRGRLLVMGIYLLCFVTSDRFLAYFYRNWRIVAGAVAVVGTFIAVSMRRAAEYGSLNDYLFAEIYTRLDGLNLVMRLREASLLSYWGQLDFEMLTPLVAKIPFLEAAQTAKLLGRTSTKQYVIQDLLRSTSLDDSNSMITDPLYLGGVAGMIMAFFALGWGLRRFDRFIAEQRLLVTFWPTTLAFAFATSVAIFENDYIGSVANIVQVGSLIVFFLALCTQRASSTSDAAPILSGRRARA